jgi:hypothetical protein
MRYFITRRATTGSTSPHSLKIQSAQIRSLKRPAIILRYRPTIIEQVS